MTDDEFRDAVRTVFRDYYDTGNDLDALVVCEWFDKGYLHVEARLPQTGIVMFCG